MDNKDNWSDSLEVSLGIDEIDLATEPVLKLQYNHYISASNWERWKNAV